MSDNLGDRMKLYEGQEADRRFIPLLPVIARIDGRSFHRFTRNMERPFDESFCDAMIETTKKLVEETNACMGYTQSDEITLAWHSTDVKSQIWFDGRIQKMTSQLAAQATIHFYREVCKKMPSFEERLPTFDARVWQVPNRTEGANVFLWREWDATKNSISMAAHHYFSNKELDGKDSNERQQMLFYEGINWNDYPPKFKRGTFIRKKNTERPFTKEERDKLPPLHAANTNPDLKVTRSEYVVVNMPPFGSVTNREEVIFEGAEPK